MSEPTYRVCESESEFNWCIIGPQQQCGCGFAVRATGVEAVAEASAAFRRHVCRATQEQG